MSEQQKIFASLSGAVVAHLLLLLVIFGLLSTKSIGSSLKDGRSPEKSGPKEVTILMSDLMEQIELEPLLPASKPFVSTDMNAAEANAPENPRFESDRNTSAASELPPDPILPQENVPTLEGDSPLPHLTLQNRDYIEGQINEPLASSASQGSSSQASSAPAAASAVTVRNTPEPAKADTPPETKEESGEGDKREEGEKELPEETVAARRSRAQGEDSAEMISREVGRDESEDTETRSQRSFSYQSDDPRAATLGPMSPDQDRFAAKGGEPEGGEETTDPEQEKSKTVPESSKEPTPPEAASPVSATSAGGDGLKPADKGLFAEGFSPEERRNAIQGGLTRVGRNAVDAEETALGRYKKAVRDAISAQWHRYRQDNADFVTWGILKLEFAVDSRGRVNNLHITKNEANAILAEFSLKAIRDAKLPPMPEDVANSVGPQGLVIQYDIIIY